MFGCCACERIEREIVTCSLRGSFIIFSVAHEFLSIARFPCLFADFVLRPGANHDTAGWLASQAVMRVERSRACSESTDELVDCARCGRHALARPSKQSDASVMRCGMELCECLCGVSLWSFPVCCCWCFALPCCRSAQQASSLFCFLFLVF